MVTRSQPTTNTDRHNAGGAAIIGADRRDSDGPGPQVMSAATLIGDSVTNEAGDPLGKIEAITLDVLSGRIAYAVLSFGGFLGVGNKLFAIPWSALTLDAEDKCFILNVDRKVLESAPGVDKDHWPSMADTKWATSLHSHYGAPPYWTAPLESASNTRTIGRVDITNKNSS